MMTLYIAFEQIEGPPRLLDQDQDQRGGRRRRTLQARARARRGDRRSIDAIKALVTKSANDVAVAIAEHIAGSEAGFARLMNEQGAPDRHARDDIPNASGLPDPDQITTARDMLTLALRLQDDFPRHYRLFSPEVVHLPRRDLPQPQHAAARLSPAPTASRPATRARPASTSSPRCAATASTSSPPYSAASTARVRDNMMQQVLNKRARKGLD